MYNPVATYRLQFNKDFSFTDFENMLPYLQRLGVRTIYSSPIFQSTPGSTHGYDGLDPHKIDPEIGTRDQLQSIHKKLKQENIGWLQDIVPNHMAFHPANPWLMDVLEKGQKSLYASFFDVSWTGKIFHGKMMVPFLGDPLSEVIEKKELQIDYQDQRLVFNYFDSHYPLSSLSYLKVLQDCEGENNAIKTLIEALHSLRQVEDAKVYRLEWDEFLLQFSSLMKNEAFRTLVTASIEKINLDNGQITQLAASQHYQLSYWQRTDTRINFRRFFTVNGLIALNIQDKEVFEHYHQFIQQLVADGIMQGLRIDHIDGLYDPTAYLQQLRKLAGDETYIVVEKILEPGEHLVKDWPIQGNSGYDFLGTVNNLLTNNKSREKFTAWYQQLTGDDTSIHQQIKEKKALILSENMGGELDNLSGLFKSLNLASEEEIQTLKPDELNLAIGDFLIECPVYRYYGNQMPLTSQEALSVKDILDNIRQNKPGESKAIDLLENALLVRPLKKVEYYNEGALRFYQRLMQFTGPLMAKGVEDTLMYTFNRFIGHNEVGDSPEAFGITVKEYHDKMIVRKRDWPLSINCTSTHDTKRGEDVRARLNVLTDIPEEWFAKVDEWRQMNAALKVDGAPDDNDEYFIYQTLMGVYAMPGQKEDDLINRLEEYLQKALREAKTNSNWATPNETYENAVKSFAVLLLDKRKPFFKSFSEFHYKVAEHGVVNSLVQVMLRFTSPGVPDTYQGTELWDLSMVDPDNRRPVDYAKMRLWLNDIENEYSKDARQAMADLWSDRFNGKIKLWLTHLLFNLRKQHTEVFTKGEYVSLPVEGEYKEHIIAFARRFKEVTIVIIAPLHLAALCAARQKDVLCIDWQDTRILMPANVQGDVTNLMSGQKAPFSKEISIQGVFTEIPLAIYKIEEVRKKERAAGILMHITSLPSAFGIGDMGPEAYRFADFLNKAGQKYWQILPLNPTEQGQGHSPYSSICSMAGNTLLISPDLLAKDGFLTEEEVMRSRMASVSKVNFTMAEKTKSSLFDKAWKVFSSQPEHTLRQSFEAFCKQENAWLHDFALYIVLKQLNKGQAWFQWPEQYRLRDSDALVQLGYEHEDNILQIKWLQFIFLQQWKKLKSHCNRQGIEMFGDLPIYASYDSADVWAKPGIFSLDEEGKLIHVAGVPPDHFSADGQLWGMPVFKWDVLKENKYEWWINRLRKNTELFDLLRLDHFRAFADYWQVPAGEKTARNGKWQPGPGSDFFREVKKRLGDLPFVAEDLGDINEPVYALRDQYKMPGMKVLQFAFGGGMPGNPYIPHNYSENFLVYTGTHDNNTTKGWYRKDATVTEKDNLEKYAGYPLTEENINEMMNRLALGSVAKIAILPIQDILGLDENARMNKPSTSQNNWSWRLLPRVLDGEAEKHLLFLTKLYNR